MKRFALVVLLAAATVLAGSPAVAVRAQSAPSPTATPMDPHLYSDLGMDYTAPPEAYLVGRHPVSESALSQDLEPVAIWIIDPGKPEARIVKIEMESFIGDPSNWEGQFESQLHGQVDGLLIKNKTPIKLTNGMPATFVEIAFGSGFDAKKEFAVVFGDGRRGIVISEIGRVGELSITEAQRVLKDAKAVVYPLDRDTGDSQ